MSQQNVEVVSVLFAAFNERNFDAAVAYVDPNAAFHPAVVGGLERRVYRGHEGAREFWADIDAAWAEFRVDPSEIRDLGDDLLVVGRIFARGRESGVALDVPAAWIIGMREGQMCRFQSFTTVQEALQAAGLQE